jgi:hypothetical protein
MLGVKSEYERLLSLSDGASKYPHVEHESDCIDDSRRHRGTSRDVMVSSRPRNHPDRSHFVRRRLRTNRWKISAVDGHRCDSFVRGKRQCVGGAEARKSMMVPTGVLTADH